MIEAKPDNLIGDRAYDSDKLDEELKQEGVELLAALIFACYRFSGGMFLMAAANCAWAAGSTGLCLILVLAGSLPRKLSPFQFFDGLMGREQNHHRSSGRRSPKPYRHRSRKTCIHRCKCALRVSSGGSALLQCSHVGRSSSIVPPKTVNDEVMSRPAP